MQKGILGHVSARWIIVAIVVTVIIGGVGVALWQRDTDGPRVTTVTPDEGGKLSVDGVTVTVPPGAVKREVKLAITPPKREKPGAAPLSRMASRVLSFDITLDNGRVTTLEQGKKIGLSVDAKRHFPSAPVKQLVLFTPEKGKKGSLLAYERIGTTVKNGQMTAQLPHLSPFQIVLPEPPKWVRATVNRVGQNLSDFGRWGAENVLPEGLGKKPKDCRYDLEVDGTKVNLTSDQNSGWKRGTGNTPIHACLKRKDGQVSVELVNNSLPYWAVRSSGGVEFSSEFEDTTTELTRLLLKKVIREPGVKGYLARQSKLTAHLPGLADARIHLETDMGVFHAEELAIVVSLLGDILGLKDGALKALFEIESVIGCLRDSAEFSDGGNIVSQLTRLYEVVASKCGEVIFEALGYSGFLPNTFAVAGTIFEAGVGLAAGFESALRKLGDPIVVYVSVTQPQVCISEGEFRELYPHAKTIRRIVCGGNYAAVEHDSTMPNLVYILERTGSGWNLVYANEGVADPPPCGEVPSNVGSLIGC